MSDKKTAIVFSLVTFKGWHHNIQESHQLGLSLAKENLMKRGQCHAFLLTDKYEYCIGM